VCWYISCSVIIIAERYKYGGEYQKNQLFLAKPKVIFGATGRYVRNEEYKLGNLEILTENALRENFLFKSLIFSKFTNIIGKTYDL